VTNLVEEHDHRFPPDEWPFDEPMNRAAISTRQVVREGLPVLLVSHDEDGDWQILCGTTNNVDDALIVCLACAYEGTPDIGELADLPRGWTAWRDAPGERWSREPKADDTSEE